MESKAALKSIYVIVAVRPFSSSQSIIHARRHVLSLLPRVCLKPACVSGKKVLGERKHALEKAHREDLERVGK